MSNCVECGKEVGNLSFFNDKSEQCCSQHCLIMRGLHLENPYIYNYIKRLESLRPPSLGNIREEL